MIADEYVANGVVLGEINVERCSNVFHMYVQFTAVRRVDEASVRNCL